MDPVTHGLASLALQRGFFPRATWRSALAIILAGTMADLDWFTAGLGPAEYLRWHRSATHSLVFVMLLAVLAGVFKRRVRKQESSVEWIGLSSVALAAAALLHVAMDSLQADPVSMLWPFSTHTFAFDLLPSLDVWLLAGLGAAILLPELFRLVGTEIGARNKSPRGRNGAIAAFALIALYLAARAQLHATVVASLDAHTTAGEMPRRVAAFPDTASPFLWHGVVETQSTLNLITLRALGGEPSIAGPFGTIHKPDPSAMLAAAQSSTAAVAFLRYARFPKATVQKETEGFSVEIQDLRDQATGAHSRVVFADINLDKSGAVVSSELQWRATSKP